MEEEGKKKGVGKEGKKHKKRQKKILADLKQQIEFYFSEPNLQKDRFLRQKIMEHPQGCIEIATIASFNRIKQLSDDITLVVKAMKLCLSVEVIDDQWVKPLKQLSSEPKNVDAVTVYVEKLPREADHDWIRSIFSTCGKVVYVSLPRYKSTRDIKGFAFVEFENESEVKQALEMFDQEKKPAEEESEKDAERNEENVDEPTEKQGKKNKKRKQKLSESENEDGKGKGKKLKHKKEEEKNALISDSSDNSSTPTSKKKKRNIDKETDDENESSIKVTKNVKVKSELSKNDDGDSVSAGTKRKREVNDENENDSVSVKKAKNISESDNKDLSVDDVDKKHKKRKRKKKEKKESDVPNLKVISKVEWLRLKQEYQKLQRKAMTETKINLKKNQIPSTQTDNTCKNPSALPQGSTEMEISNKTEMQRLPAKLEMQPGVVLKYFTEESIEKQNLHHMFSAIAPVSYVEKQVDQEMGFVRFQTKEGCQKILEAVKNGSLEAIRVEELSETEDTEYWEKLNKDRLEKLQQHKRRKKQRGTEKIADKIEAQAKKRDHIHFSE